MTAKTTPKSNRLTWIENPDKEGYWLFVGTRTSRSGRFNTDIAAPTHVKKDKGYPELTVYYPGSGMLYVVSQHSGLWAYLGDVLDATSNVV